MTELESIRARESCLKGQVHKLARKALNEFINADYKGPVCLEGLFPWKAYVAWHPRAEELVGPGISDASIDQFENVKDPNRGGRPRSDFIFQRIDGSAYRVHPGSKPRRDASPVYCPPRRVREQTVICNWHTFEGVQGFTFEEARRIPQIDRIGKEAAFRSLQDDRENFQWWRFAANLGQHTERVFGDGLTSAKLMDHTDAQAILRLYRRDGSAVDVELRMGGKGVKVRVAPADTV